ncbi:MAG TPA: hypothetical protein VMU62_03275, partial [Acidobacteriaceae bacterium]|nr:hypothetical protein [Acidobacteriaceae bacterium]
MKMKWYSMMGAAIVLLVLPASSQAQTQTAKPSSYQGVSQPPTDPIVANDDSSATPPTQTPAVKNAAVSANTSDNANVGQSASMNTTQAFASRP